MAAAEASTSDWNMKPPLEDCPILVYADGIYDLSHFGHARSVEVDPLTHQVIKICDFGSATVLVPDNVFLICELVLGGNLTECSTTYEFVIVVERCYLRDLSNIVIVSVCSYILFCLYEKAMATSPIGGEFLTECLMKSLESKGIVIKPRYSFRRKEIRPGEFQTVDLDFPNTTESYKLFLAESAYSNIPMTPYELLDGQ
ncbi:hypothetical protein RIF29_33889 [Crotalaria pallida]|uniref:Uncharacterized protein n=1 Tax=Crotalaria pallida TaxID=3830 RepID=A0AAN9E9I8_CROPI